MANLRPADAYYGEFTTQTPSTGAATAADSLPTATATRNGADDATFTLTCASLATGRYKVTGTIPSGYAAGDSLQISVTAVMGGVTGKRVIDSFVLDSKRLSDLNDLSAAGAATATQTGLTAQGYTGTLATNLGTTNTRVALALPNAAAGASGGLPLGDASARVQVQSGTGTGQLDITAGVVKANVAQILGTALTETAGQLAAGFKKFFNVGSPASTMEKITEVGLTDNLGDARLDGIGTAGDLANDPTLFGQAYRIAGRSDNLPDLPAAVGDAMTLTTGERGTLWAGFWDTLTSATRTAGSFGAKLKAWVLGSDSKALLSTDAQTGVTIPTVTTLTNAVDVVTALKADAQWKKLYAYSHGKFDFDPATGILRLYDVDNTTVLTTFTLTKDVSGNTTARTVS